MKTRSPARKSGGYTRVGDVDSDVVVAEADDDIEGAPASKNTLLEPLLADADADAEAMIV
jgi:hypothetical protein